MAEYVRSGSNVPDGMVIEVSEFDSSMEMGREMISAAQQDPGKGIVVDMREVMFLASVGYGPLISLRSCVKEAGGRLILCNLTDPLKDVLTATRMLINPSSKRALFEYADSLDEAIHALSEES